jgi:putative proteasome-type protease
MTYCVGLPIDLVVIRGDTFTADVTRRIEASEPYFRDFRERWSASLQKAHRAIPRPPYLGSTN